MTDAEDLLLEIANSMSKPFIDPVEHANWCVEEAKKYFVERGKIAAGQPALSELEIAALCGGTNALKRLRRSK